MRPHGSCELAPDFLTVGMKSYGRAPTFLVTTGNEQVRSIAAHLAGDDAAADEVQLGVFAPDDALSDGQVGAGVQAQDGCCNTCAPSSSTTSLLVFFVRHGHSDLVQPRGFVVPSTPSTRFDSPEPQAPAVASPL